MKKPIERHRGSTCYQNQLNENKDARWHRLYILDEICVLKCPRCKTVCVQNQYQASVNDASQGLHFKDFVVHYRLLSISLDVAPLLVRWNTVKPGFAFFV